MLLVVSSIDLYDEIALSANEIHDVYSDKGLALELRPSSLRLRSLDQRSRSASVDCFLSSFALDI